jgi:hypothetical protein
VPCQSNHSGVQVPQNSRLYFYCLIWDSSNLEGQIPIFTSPMNRVAQLFPPGNWVPFCQFLRLAGLRWRFSTPQPQGPPPHFNYIT